MRNKNKTPCPNIINFSNKCFFFKIINYIIIKKDNDFHLKERDLGNFILSLIN